MTERLDDDLVLGAQAGDLDAYGDLVRRHHARIAGLCATLLDNGSDVDDAVQEIFLKAHRGLRRFQRGARFSTWIYRIALNHCHDVRRSSRRRKTFSLDALIMDHGESVVPPAPAAAGDRPKDRTRELEVVRSLMAGLPEDYRQALSLRTQGLSYERIAETLGCSLDAVKARLRRARKLLASGMRKMGFDGQPEASDEVGERR